MRACRRRPYRMADDGEQRFIMSRGLAPAAISTAGIATEDGQVMRLLIVDDEPELVEASIKPSKSKATPSMLRTTDAMGY